ncbi:MAG: RDD family protein [Solirubrobacterales bacterium]|nr:RDD family protein [Solirubrobacterales bacterium]
MSTSHYTRAPSGERTGFWRRCAAVFLDGIAIASVTTILFAVSKTGSYFLSLLIALAYYTCLEGGRRGQTLGKRVLRIRVVDINTGESIGYNRAAVRYLGSILSALAIYIGYLWMLWDAERQTWHDKFVHSVVVPESAYPVR